jgi:hypothetical protein
MFDIAPWMKLDHFDSLPSEKPLDVNFLEFPDLLPLQLRIRECAIPECSTEIYWISAWLAWMEAELEAGFLKNSYQRISNL